MLAEAARIHFDRVLVWQPIQRLGRRLQGRSLHEFSSAQFAAHFDGQIVVAEFSGSRIISHPSLKCLKIDRPQHIATHEGRMFVARRKSKVVQVIENLTTVQTITMPDDPMSCTVLSCGDILVMLQANWNDPDRILRFTNNAGKWKEVPDWVIKLPSSIYGNSQAFSINPALNCVYWSWKSGEYRRERTYIGAWDVASCAELHPPVATEHHVLNMAEKVDGGGMILAGSRDQVLRVSPNGTVLAASGQVRELLSVNTVIDGRVLVTTESQVFMF